MKMIDDDDNNSDNEQNACAPSYPAPSYPVPSRTGRGGGRKGKQKGGPFRDDLKKLMYGYGDD